MTELADWTFSSQSYAQQNAAIVCEAILRTLPKE